jgi:MoaA/NifB/PqqE/SkfB family radical SAM enzyme
MVLAVKVPWDQSRRYEYSKLYYATEEHEDFSEDRVLCFRVQHGETPLRVRLVIPATVLNAQRIHLRLDPLPQCTAGRYRVLSLSCVEPADDAATRTDGLRQLKAEVRQRVVQAEASSEEVCTHYPESLNIELTAACNLNCGICSAHGLPDLHRRHNKMPELAIDVLSKVADEVFPSLTAVCLVGRGEPTVVSNALWELLVDRVAHHDVLLSVVTNGTTLKKRITAELLPHLDMLTVSIDGASEGTFERNRGGASLQRVLDNIEHFCGLRRTARLLRRPRLGFSWTLRRNNIREFPDFIRLIARFEPDLVYARHLMVFFDKDRHETLVDDPGVANAQLQEAYELIRAYGIQSDCPPLATIEKNAPTDVDSEMQATGDALLQSASKADRCMFVHRTGVILSDGQVPICSRPYVPEAGRLCATTSFENIWNGPTMRAVRTSLGTDREWRVCRDCWYREGRYSAQRAAAEKGQTFDLTQKNPLTNEAWDFRGNE